MDLSDRLTSGTDGSLDERLDSLATWVNDIDGRLRVAEVATGDEKTARELRKALEALAHHDPKLEKRVSDHVAVVTQRFETLASTVATTAAALTAREGEIAGLRREVEEASKRLGELGRQSGKGVDAKEVARLRGIVDALSAQRPARTSDSRVDELGAKVRLLAERTDSLTATVSANAAALGRRDTELAAVRERLDAETRKVEQMAADMRRLGQDDTLSERLDALQVALVEANGAIADREQEAEQLRARIDEAYSHTGAAVTELQRTVGDVAGRVDELRELPRAAATALEQRARKLDGRIDEVVARVGQLVESNETAQAGIGQRDAQLQGLYRDVEAERERLDATVAELRGELASLTANEARLDERSNELVGRIDDVERARADEAARVRQTDEAWLQERDWVRRQLERLAEAHEEASSATATLGPALGDLRARLDALEAERPTITEQNVALITRLEELAQDTASGRATSDQRHEATAKLVGDLTARVEALRPDGAPAERVAELAARLARVESAAQSAAAAAAVAAAASPEEELAEIRTILDGALARMTAIESSADNDQGLAEVRGLVEGLGARLSAVEHGVEDSDDGLAEVRALVDETVARVASNEQAAAGASAWKQQLDALAKRFEAAERVHAQPGAPAVDGVEGDGRFRLELRALELRMQHAESAARENREAVLTQLERLATRIEWRLQRLEEAAQTESEAEEVGAQILPIRGGSDAS
jgi:chromosome segregation ATPase